MTKVIVAGPLAAPDHTLAGHPERPSRVDAVAAGIDDLMLDSDRVDLDPRAATIEELAAVHDPAYLRELQAFCEAGGGKLDPDTYAASASWLAACEAAGAGLAAIDALAAGSGDVAFVVARPPGHHALADRAMGFCLLNNVAVAAATLAASGERVIIIDWDVHHGNGTQALFWNDDRVCYVSTHQDRFYPGTGGLDETGGPDAAWTDRQHSASGRRDRRCGRTRPRRGRGAGFGTIRADVGAGLRRIRRASRRSARRPRVVERRLRAVSRRLSEGSRHTSVASRFSSKADMTSARCGPRLRRRSVRSSVRRT